VTSYSQSFAQADIADLDAESRSQEVAAGTLLKVDGTNLFKKHGCWWGDK